MLRRINFIYFVFSLFVVGFSNGQDTIIKDYWENGKIRNLKLKLKSNVDSVFYFYQNGKIRFTGAEVNGKKRGLWTYFRENGNLLKTDYYKNGMLDSLSFHYGVNKKIEEIRTYYKDTLNGFLFKFYSSGQIMIIDYNVNGVSLFSETYYEISNKISTVKNQLPQGVFFIRSCYPNGKLKRLSFKINNRIYYILLNENGILVGNPKIESE